MESSTTIKGMTQGNQIFVPNYQRAYSWEVGKNPSEKKQVETFLADLEDYLASKAASKNTDDFSPYYFGHFLYEKTGDCEYAIIDGQQRQRLCNQQSKERPWWNRNDFQPTHC